jgi:hypothetical protein
MLRRVQPYPIWPHNVTWTQYPVWFTKGLQNLIFEMDRGRYNQSNTSDQNRKGTIFIMQKISLSYNQRFLR